MAANIWLASYPKSGNTWVRVFLACLSAGRPLGINEIGVGLCAAQRGVLDSALDVATADLAAEVVDSLRPRIYDQVAAESRHSLIWKVHDGCRRAADGEWLFPPGSTLGAIYVVRDPRDVAPSLAHHKGIDIDRAIASMADPNGRIADDRPGPGNQLPQLVGRWDDHVEGWLAAPFPVHLVRYEDLRADPLAAFTAMVRFIGRDDSAQAIAAAIDAARFDRLSSQERQDGFRERLPEATAPFFRSGRVGGWREDLTPAQADRLVADHGRVMRQLGYLPT